MTTRLRSKHAESHAADPVLHFILKATGHKRNVNFKRVGNPCPENLDNFFLSLKTKTLF